MMNFILALHAMWLMGGSGFYQRTHNSLGCCLSLDAQHMIASSLYRYRRSFNGGGGEGGGGARLLMSATPTSASASVDAINALPDSKRRLSEAQLKITSNLSPEVINYNNLVETVKDLEVTSSQPGFWDDLKRAQDILTEMNRLKAMISRVDGWKVATEDVGVLIEMMVENPAEQCKRMGGGLALMHRTHGMFLWSVSTAEYASEVTDLLHGLETDLARFEVERLLGGKYDKYSCMMCIQSGAGGTEAQDWAGT